MQHRTTTEAKQQDHGQAPSRLDGDDLTLLRRQIDECVKSLVKTGEAEPILRWYRLQFTKGDRCWTLRAMNDLQRVAILELMNDTERLEAIKLMSDDQQAAALTYLPEAYRLGLLERMDDTHRSKALQNLAAREQQRLRGCGHGKGVPPFSIATGDHPESWPITSWNCFECDEPYLEGQDIIGIGCGLHTFHNNNKCMPKIGICPNCPDGTKYGYPEPEEWLPY